MTYSNEYHKITSEQLTEVKELFEACVKMWQTAGNICQENTSEYESLFDYLSDLCNGEHNYSSGVYDGIWQIECDGRKYDVWYQNDADEYFFEKVDPW